VHRLWRVRGVVRASPVRLPRRVRPGGPGRQLRRRRGVLAAPVPRPQRPGGPRRRGRRALRPHSLEVETSTPTTTTTSTSTQSTTAACLPILPSYCVRAVAGSRARRHPLRHGPGVSLTRQARPSLGSRPPTPPRPSRPRRSDPRRPNLRPSVRRTNGTRCALYPFTMKSRNRTLALVPAFRYTFPLHRPLLG
jgi:hypothetical protein